MNYENSLRARTGCGADVDLHGTQKHEMTRAISTGISACLDCCSNVKLYSLLSHRMFTEFGYIMFVVSKGLRLGARMKVYGIYIDRVEMCCFEYKEQAALTQPI